MCCKTFSMRLTATYYLLNLKAGFDGWCFSYTIDVLFLCVWLAHVFHMLEVNIQKT